MTPGDYRTQLSELTIKLSAMVAERIAYWSKDMDPSQRQPILNMIEGDLPTVISNTVEKTASLHSASGVSYLEQNLESFADSLAKKFIGQ